MEHLRKFSMKKFLVLFLVIMTLLTVTLVVICSQVTNDPLDVSCRPVIGQSLPNLCAL